MSQSIASQVAITMRINEGAAPKHSDSESDSDGDEDEDVSIIFDKEDIISNSTVNKRKSSDDADETVKKESKYENTRFQQHCPGKYRAFYTHMDPPTGGSQKHTQVRCDLCSGGTILSLGNYGTHLRAFHLPNVICDICGLEVKASRVQFHKKKCVWQNLEFNEN